MSGRRVHLQIRGLVQGVSYRASTRAQALSLGLTGWVRNLPNGDVEAVAEGPTEAVEALVRWCRVGPEEARVTSVAVLDEPVERLGERLAGFEVRR